jgi:hypothetical protein
LLWYLKLFFLLLVWLFDSRLSILSARSNAWGFFSRGWFIVMCDLSTGSCRLVADKFPWLLWWISCSCWSTVPGFVLDLDPKFPHGFLLWLFTPISFEFLLAFLHIRAPRRGWCPSVLRTHLHLKSFLTKVLLLTFACVSKCSFSTMC